MLTCYGCGITVHHYCYGLKTPINKVRESNGEIVKMFVCDRCHENGPNGVKVRLKIREYDRGIGLRVMPTKKWSV